MGILKDTYKKTKARFEVQPKYRSEFQSLLADSNVSKLLPIFITTFIIHLPLVGLDIYRWKHGVWNNIPAYKYMFYMHLLLFSILIPMIGVTTFYHRRTSGTGSPGFLKRNLGNIFVYAVMIWFIGMTFVDQKINGQLSDYIIAVLGYAIIFFTRPEISFLSLFSGALLFDITVSRFQRNSDILISHVINANSITLIAFIVSIIFYRQFVKSFIDKKTIEEKTRKLNETLRIIYRDLKETREIHTRIMPSRPLDHKNIKHTLTYIPANHVGGDFYDYFTLDENTVRVLVGDVAGHGVSAALNSMAIKSEYDKIKFLDKPASEILHLLDKLYLEKYHGIVLPFTMLLVDINLLTKEIIYCSAGHPGPIHQVHGGKALQFPQTGGMLGIAGFNREVKLHTRCFNIGNGDTIYFYTDGVFEQFNEHGEMYGEERLLKQLNHDNFNSMILENKIEYLVNDIKEHLGAQELNDDISLLAFEIIQ